MLIRRGWTHHSMTFGAVCFICLCVFMQMLGTTMTFWNLNLPLDSVDTPTLEGFSLPTTSSSLQPSGEIRPYQNSSPSLRPFLREQALFHPPILSF